MLEAIRGRTGVLLVGACLLVAVGAAVGLFLTVSRGPRYTNPVYDHDAPDPTVIRASDGDFYAYTTQSIYGPTLKNIPVLRSDDLIHWKYVRDALPSLPKWAVIGERDSWAPHVLEHDGRYLMYFSERRAEDDTMAIGVAVSDEPQGPFRDAIGKPLVTGPSFTAIDPFVMPYRGKLWMWWGSAGAPIQAQQLSTDGLETVGLPRIVLQREFGEPYEALIEGPWLIENDGWWYLMYSGDACCDEIAHYAVLVARSRSPFGPFERHPDNPIVEANETFNAPGHNSVVVDNAGREWLAYHAYVRPDFTFREMLIDPIEWVDGWPVVADGDAPTSDPQAAPVIESERGPEGAGHGSRGAEG
jgi:arabinan endo-1,5-alpha-L-arabinosidase